MRIGAVTLLKLLPAVAVIALLLGVVTILYVIRARSMRALAARWGFKYVGPRAPKWSTKISPPLPVLFPTCHPAGRRITHVWNLIEGQQNGVSVLIFDSIIGEGKASGYCTVVACQTEQNPFGIVTAPDREMRSSGWTVVHGVWFLHFSWTMGRRRLDRYIKTLQVGSRLRA